MSTSHYFIVCQVAFLGFPDNCVKKPDVCPVTMNIYFKVLWTGFHTVHLFVRCMGYKPPPLWDWAHDDDGCFHCPSPPPSSPSSDKEGSDSLSGQEEGFVSHNSYEYGAVYEIRSVGLFKNIFMGTGDGVGSLKTQ